MDSPLHRRIRSDIAERILSGEWPPGFRIPFEHELMADYDCSRMTVSKALAPLAERGMIVRRKRFGSFVARPRIHSVLLDIPASRASTSLSASASMLSTSSNARSIPCSGSTVSSMRSAPRSRGD